MCPRCGERFGTDGAVDAHLRADDVCKKKDMIALDGIDREQEKKIRARPRKGNSTVEQKWVAIYKIIFPDTPEDSIPSPCKSPPSIPRPDQVLGVVRRAVR